MPDDAKAEEQAQGTGSSDGSEDINASELYTKDEVESLIKSEREIQGGQDRVIVGLNNEITALKDRIAELEENVNHRDLQILDGQPDKETVLALKRELKRKSEELKEKSATLDTKAANLDEREMGIIAKESGVEISVLQAMKLSPEQAKIIAKHLGGKNDGPVNNQTQVGDRPLIPSRADSLKGKGTGVDISKLSPSQKIQYGIEQREKAKT